MEKERNEISNKYKWTIDEIYGSKENFTEKVNTINELTKLVMAFKCKIMESSNTLFEFTKINIELERKILELYVYANMKLDEDTTNQNSKALKEEIMTLYSKVSEQTAFISPEILKSGYDIVKKYIKENNKLDKYSFYYEKLFRYEKHTLSDKEEELLSKLINSKNSGEKIYSNLTNADRRLGKIKDNKNKEVELTPANYSEFIKDKNKDIRKQAFETMHTFYKNHINTISECYINCLKETANYTKIRNYNSSIEKSLYSDNINIKVYKNLIETISKNLNVVHEYFKLKKEISSLDQMNIYDVYINTTKSLDEKYNIDKAKEIIFNALIPLGNEYKTNLKKAFTDNWIDLYPNEGKRTGAYSWGTYDTKPYILINYNNDYNSVSTLAHELGHSIHRLYSKENNEYHYSKYPIFLAEVASTVNEVLLSEYMFKNSKTKEEKIYHINNLLDLIKSTVFRQTMFAEFEMIIHDKNEKEIPITEELLSNTYYDLVKKYHGEDIIYDELIKYEWSRIPHFYTPFYVYKYATGLSAAIQIAYDILEEKEGSKEKYLEFLKSGGKDYPLNTLNKAGVDMTTSIPILKTIEVFENKLNQLKKIISKDS